MVAIARTEHTAEARQEVWSGHVALIAKPGGPATGVGRYVQMLHAGLRDVGVDAVRVAPIAPPLPDAGYRLLRRAGMDLRTFLMNYPIWVRYPAADVYHLTSQNLASLLLFQRPPGKVIVTVHDIIPYMLRDDPELSSYRTTADRLFDRMAMAGLRRADRLIADSQYTKQCIVEHLGIAADKIEVIYLGIDHERFRPMPVPAALRVRYRLPADRRYLIYVGSEDPRKNLTTLMRALTAVRTTLPDVELIKVGRAHFDGERQRLIKLASELGVLTAIHFLDDVPEEDLPLLYNLADVCVMPSLYEGFGFPVLEAMACGTPTICASAASLPELVDGAGLLFDIGADSPSTIAAIVARVLAQPEQIATTRAAGLARAGAFTWPHTVHATLGICIMGSGM
jgi:glycosyltransferase involved in cell wall biosynthesis